MKDKEKVAKLIEALKAETTTEQELHFIEECERKLNGKLPRVEVIDDKHQKFNGEIYTKREKNGYYVIWKTLHKEVMKYYLGGDIPENLIIHHNKKTKEGYWDRSKNNIEDLKLVTKAEHEEIHQKRKLNLEFKDAVCTVCGKKFKSKYHGGSRRPFLCSAKCKNIWAANQIEERVCVICGKTFTICKYKKSKCCSYHCGNILGHLNRKEKSQKMATSE